MYCNSGNLLFGKGFYKDRISVYISIWMYVCMNNLSFCLSKDVRLYKVSHELIYLCYLISYSSCHITFF